MGGKCENCVYYSYDEEYDDPETSTSPPGSNKNNTAPAKAGAVLFLLRLNRILNVNDAQLGSVGSAHHNLYTFHTIYTAQGLH